MYLVAIAVGTVVTAVAINALKSLSSKAKSESAEVST